MTDSDLQKHKRELRLRIGRMRRQIDNRLHAARREGRRLLSWREYVIRYPTYASLTAFGTGLAASSGFLRRRLLQGLGLKVARQAVEHAGLHLWREMLRIWSQSGDKP
jgi:hypothetical protein